MTSKKSKVQHTSLAKTLHTEGVNLSVISRTLAGLPPAEFCKEIQPLCEYFQKFDEDGKLAEMMLVDNITNHLVDGLYVRELLIPRGAVIISRVHKRALVNIISKGKVIVIDTHGCNEYTAPCTFISKAGTQRFVCAPEETVWNTAHITDVTNPDDLVDDLTFTHYSEFISYSKQLTNQE